MDEKEFTKELQKAIDLATDEEIMDEIGEDVSLRVVSTHLFDEVGLLTTDEGLVIRMKNGQEFHATIKRARNWK